LETQISLDLKILAKEILILYPHGTSDIENQAKQ
jgi:hypothetical protein